jgi:hypothetical protein
VAISRDGILAVVLGDNISFVALELGRN